MYPHAFVSVSVSIWACLQGVVLKYSEPEEARKPKLHWRLYPFKGTEELRMSRPTAMVILETPYDI
jgi:hypothetical protein